MNKANSGASPERLSGLVGGDRNPLGVWRSAFSVPGDRGDVGVPGVSWREDVITETGATVLVVDDDAPMRESLMNLIRSVGLRAELFASAQEFLRSKRPDVLSCLVLDVSRPFIFCSIVRYRRQDYQDKCTLLVYKHSQ